MTDIYKNERKQPLEKSFGKPGCVFRGAPFWSWNTKLEENTLLRQIEIFKEMGIGGFHMHSRVGLDTEYLGTDFMGCVRACVEKARQEDMLAWLYDEDRWPSGAAGGLVTKDPQYRARYLLFLPIAHMQKSDTEWRKKVEILATYAVTLRNGYLAAYRMIREGDPVEAGEVVWQACKVTEEPSSWFNGQTYLDTLNPKAVQRFVEVTHEKYKSCVGKDFGGIVPAIFTDEPQFTHKKRLSAPEVEEELSMPYTDDFPETYKAAYGEEFFPTMPELFWELPEGRRSVARYRYHDHVAERFSEAFADTVGNWCKGNGIALTGHMMEERDLNSQSQAIGEAMRSYRSFQLPGIDMLCDAREYTTAKQAQSATHQFGYPGVLSELYGVTGWDFDFAGHKSQGDWQAALGVTVRVHHLSWVSMKGEAKRDYPASIFYQSPWYKRYKVVEDHFARVNAALTRGRPHVRIGLIHPIESYWLVFGVETQNAIACAEMSQNFFNGIHWLLESQLDFDYICESLLPQQCAPEALQKGKGFAVGVMSYDVVVVPPMLTMRSTTLERLQAFVKAGGRVVFAGEVPTYVDGIQSAVVSEFSANCEQISFSREALTSALEPVREISILHFQGGRACAGGTNSLFYQMRQDEDGRLLFICNTDRESVTINSRVAIQGEWKVEMMNTQNGEIVPLAVDYKGGKTLLEYTFFPHGHLLLRLKPGRCMEGARSAWVTEAYSENDIVSRLPSRMPVTLSEPNALVLDQAQWRVSGGDWEPLEEVLRIGNLARDAAGINKGGGFSGSMVQPWCAEKDNKVYGTLELRFVVESEVTVSGAKLAVELSDGEEILLDGKPLIVVPEGWWVDEAIRTVSLPDFASGTHEIVRRIPLRRAYSLEWSYLLGDFGVTVAGRQARLVAPVRELVFGDITRQGLPFYTGNITYHCSLELTQDDLTLGIPSFNGAMIDVKVDGVEFPPIAYAPYRCTLTGVRKGKRKIDLIYYGTRGNAFNPLHWARPHTWIGPGAWRSGGDSWCYGYCLHDAGILSAPTLTAK